MIGHSQSNLFGEEKHLGLDTQFYAKITIIYQPKFIIILH